MVIQKGAVIADTAVEEWLRQQLAAETAKTNKTKTQKDAFTKPFSWQNAAVNKIYDDIKVVAKNFDMDLDHLIGWFDGQQNNMLNWIQAQMEKLNAVFGPLPVGPVSRGERVIDEPGGFRINLTETPEGMNHIFDLARQWVSMYWPGFRDAVLFKPPGGGGGVGRRGPTAAEIRAQFDLDQLTRLVDEMSRALVLAEEPNARAIATAYVDAIVKDPNQELDFETFVRNRILSTARAKTIYKNKPESMSEEQYLQPYVAAFQSRVGPGFGDQLANTATAGARLGASPGAFEQRLNRTRQVQTSTPFLSKMGQRLSNVQQVLR